jgi:hypothetical protein
MCPGKRCIKLWLMLLLKHNFTRTKTFCVTNQPRWFLCLLWDQCLYQKPNKQAVIYSDLHQNIGCCNERELKSCRRIIALRDGNRTTIPESYLDKEYQAPPLMWKLNKSNLLRLFFYTFNRLYLPQFILNHMASILIYPNWIQVSKWIPYWNFTDSYRTTKNRLWN